MDIELMKKLVKVIEDNLNNDNNKIYFIGGPFIIIPMLKCFYYCY